MNSFTVEQKLEETLSAIHTRITSNTCSGPATHTNCITVDSSPEINSHSRTTTPVDITSPLSSIMHENVTTNPKNSCILNSPPNKLPKSATNVSLHDSRVDQVVTNFQQLDSPSKDMHYPVDNNTSEITTGACKTPVPTTKSNVSLTTNSSPLNPVMTSTNKPTFNVFPPQHTHSYYPYLYPTPPIQPYPYAIVPPVHNPYGTGKSSTQSSPPSTCNDNFSQFNRPPLPFDSKQIDKHPQKLYNSDIKPPIPSFNFGLTLPQSPYPWFPNQSMTFSSPSFYPPSLQSACTTLGNKTTWFKSEPNTPTLTEMTNSVTRDPHCAYPTSTCIKESPDDQSDHVTIAPDKNDSSDDKSSTPSTQSCSNEASADYSSHFDIDDMKLCGKRDNILVKSEETELKTTCRPSSV